MPAGDNIHEVIWRSISSGIRILVHDFVDSLGGLNDDNRSWAYLETVDVSEFFRPSRKSWVRSVSEYRRIKGEKRNW